MKLTYSIADQNFATATSMGIYNLSIGYIRALVEHAGVDGVTILSNPTITELSGLDRKAEIKTFDYPIRHVAGRLYWDQLGCYREAKIAANPWLFLPKGFGSVIQRSPVRLAVCIADTTSVIYRERYPQAVSAAKHAYYVWSHRQTIKHADLIFTISDFSRMEIETWAKHQSLCCPPVVVAGCAADQDWPVLPRLDQIIVDVRRAPHKRTDMAIRYVEQWRRASKYAGKIIAVGTMPDDVTIPAVPAWETTGRIPTCKRKDLIASSRALVHFTEQEGFGLPPVEAIIAGTPSVYSLIPVTREVMGDTGFPFVNEDYDAFATAMDEALAVNPARVAAWGQNLKDRHNWTLCAAHMVERAQKVRMNASSTPTVTVLITAYQTRPELLREAVLSGLNQTMSDLEVLVIDDGSTPPLRKVLDGIDDPRLVYHRIEHGGLPHALIFGVKMASGKYIAILDHDDRLTADSIATRLPALQQSSAGLVYGDIEFISPQGKVIGHHAYPKLKSSSNLIRSCLISPIAPLKHGAVMFDRELALRLGNYDSAMPVEYDLDLIARIIKASGCVKVDTFVTQYRVHQGNFSGSMRYRLRQIYYRWMAINRYMPDVTLIKWAAIAFVAITNIAKGCWQNVTCRRPGFIFPKRKETTGADS